MRKILYILLSISIFSFACKKSNHSNSTITSDDGRDRTPPVITLKGETNYTLPLEGFFVEYGATAIDNKYGDISSLVSRTGTVNTSLAGAYTLKYSVQDAAGNGSEKIRTIVVKNDVDDLKLNGNYSCFTTCNQNTTSLTISTVNLTSSLTKNNYINISPKYDGFEIQVSIPNLNFPFQQGHVTGLIAGDGKSFTVTTRWGDLNNPTSFCVDIYKKTNNILTILPRLNYTNRQGQNKSPHAAT